MFYIDKPNRNKIVVVAAVVLVAAAATTTTTNCYFYYYTCIIRFHFCLPFATLRFVTAYDGLDLQSSHRGVTLLELVQSFSEIPRH